MREETTYVQQSTSSEANNRVASLDVGCCYYSVHKRPTLTQICNSLVLHIYIPMFETCFYNILVPKAWSVECFSALEFTSNICMHSAAHTYYISALIISDFVTVIHVK